jgi:hypothetical protein
LRWIEDAEKRRVLAIAFCERPSDVASLKAAVDALALWLRHACRYFFRPLADTWESMVGCAVEFARLPPQPLLLSPARAAAKAGIRRQVTMVAGGSANDH